MKHRMTVIVVTIALALVFPSMTTFAEGGEPSPVASPSVSGDESLIPSVEGASGIGVARDTATTFTVDSEWEWQDPEIFVNAGVRYVITWVSGSWTIDYNNWGYVGAGGYSQSTDQQIDPGCKYITSVQYGALLTHVIGDDVIYYFPSGANSIVIEPDVSGYVEFRINDDVPCLVDNDGWLAVSIEQEQLNCSEYTAEYFNNVNLSGAPTMTRCEGWPIDWEWDYGSPSEVVNSDGFSARWTGAANVTAGTYEFRLHSDDGSRVWFNNELIFDRWDDPPYGEVTIRRTVSNGNYPIRVELREISGAAHIFFRWDRVTETAPTITSFSANPSSPTAGQSFTLTATASADLSPTPYYITIWEGSTRHEICGNGTTCSVTLNKSAGSYNFQARISDQNGGSVQSSQNLSVSVAAQQRTIQIDPNAGERNTWVKVTGRNFLPSTTLYLYWDDSRLIWNAEPVSSDGSGSFTAYFQVPGGASAGSHTVSVSDGAGSASSSFRVDVDDDSGGTVTVRLHVTCMTGYLGMKVGSAIACDSAVLTMQGRDPLHDGIVGRAYSTGFGTLPSFEFTNIPEKATFTITVFYKVSQIIGEPTTEDCTISGQAGNPLLGITHIPSRFESERCGSISGTNSVVAEAIQSTFTYADDPVVSGAIQRTWLWGPNPITESTFEAYDDSTWSTDAGSAGVRYVVYYDKSRMEVTHPEGDASSIWYVTNGLLATELITGNLQLGDNTFEHLGSAEVNVAGDSDDPTGPTYRTFNVLRGYVPLGVGSVLTQRVNRDSGIWDDVSLAGYNVRAAYLDTATNHTVASPFWEYMNSSGLVYKNGEYVYDKLFENPFYATGRPITEAYWARVKVGGTYKDVLIQCFERRCLTYTPGNPDGWQVEAGNVGLHYYIWRYGEMP